MTENWRNFLCISDLLKRILKQCLSGHGDLHVAGQGVGLERGKEQQTLTFTWRQFSSESENVLSKTHMGHYLCLALRFLSDDIAIHLHYLLLKKEFTDKRFRVCSVRFSLFLNGQCDDIKPRRLKICADKTICTAGYHWQVSVKICFYRT